MLNINFTNETNLFVDNPKQKQFTALLFVHFLIIIAGLFLLSYARIYISVPLVFVYVLIVKTYYPNSFRRLAKPKFWMQLFVLVLFTTLFFNGFGSKDLFDKEGLLAGLLMSFRAILLVTAFTAISFELRNPVVKAVLFKKGFSQLYVSLGLAFGALPSLLEQIVRPENLLKSPSKQIAQLINYSEYLLQSFQNESYTGQNIIIISGKQGQGKTSFLKEVIAELQKDKLDIDGIIATGIDKKTVRQGFQLSRIKTGKTYALSTINPTPEFTQYGRFYFNPLVFKKVNTVLKNATAACIVIDEIGPLELQNRGWSPSIEKLLSLNKPMIWIVRKSALERVINYWEISQAQVFDISKYTPEKVAGAVKKQLD